MAVADQQRRPFQEAFLFHSNCPVAFQNPSDPAELMHSLAPLFVYHCAITLTTKKADKHDERD